MNKTKSPNHNKDTFIVVMPALNEESYIEDTIESWIPVISDFPGSKILVIEGGSDDGTRIKLDKLSKKYDFLSIVDQEDNGHGNAIMQGYKMAIDSNRPWVFQTDADGHFDPTDFYKFWEKKDNSYLILGHRHKRKDPYYRIALARLISLWILILFNENIKDPNIPFRLIRKDYLKKIVDKVPEGAFAPNIFLSILAAKDGHELHHFPVKHKPRNKEGYKKLKLLKGTFKGFFELILFSFLVI